MSFKFGTDAQTLNAIRKSFMRYTQVMTASEWSDMDNLMREDFQRLFTGSAGKYMWYASGSWLITLYDHYPACLSLYPELQNVARMLDDMGHHVVIIRNPIGGKTGVTTFVLPMDALFYFHDKESDLGKETIPYFLTVFETLYGVD